MNGQPRVYGYDFLSRMTSLNDTNGTTFSYAFDGEGNRTQQSLNDCLAARFVYDGPNVVLEVSAGGGSAYGGNASNEVVRAYVNGPGMDQPIERIAFIGGTPRNRRVFHADGLGSIVALTDENGEPVQTYTYGAFGGIRARTGYDLNRITYTAREAFGDSLGFYYYRNRVLDPNTGRFTSEDPLGFIGTANRYLYVRNNPARWVDPLGLAPGDPYQTKDEAGCNAIKDINDTSIKENKQYGGWIYENSDGTFTYSKPKKGNATSCGMPFAPFRRKCGDYHTHGAADPRYGNETFSNTDMEDNDEHNRDGYLGTPSGSTLKYTPVPGQPKNRNNISSCD